MTSSANDEVVSDRRDIVASEAEAQLPVLAQYAIAFICVAIAGLLAYIANQVVPAPALTLIFVLPVIIAGALLGWGPSIAATVTSVVVYDFFFTQPYYSLRISDPSEIWAAMLLLTTAAIVGTVTWRSRLNAFEARRAAEQANALRDLAHHLIQGASQPEIVRAAAASLGRIFRAPAAVLCDRHGQLRLEAATDGVSLSPSEIEAAKSALSEKSAMRAQTYPHDKSSLDFFPVGTMLDCRYVLGVDFSRSLYERPANPEDFIEIVGAYLTAGSRQETKTNYHAPESRNIPSTSSPGV